MRYVVLLLLVLTFACTHKKSKPTTPIIPENKFVNILVYYHLSEGVANSRFFNDHVRNVKEINLQDSVLKQFGYNKAIFDSSLTFYASSPEKFDMLYEKAITELSRILASEQAAELKKTEPKKPKKAIKKDSTEIKKPR